MRTGWLVAVELFFAASLPAQQISAANGANAIFTSPMATVNLQVSVTDGSGAPLAGQSVLFIAPADGPGGEFTPGMGDRQTRVSTDANGSAWVPLYTNSNYGVFVVSAWLEGTQSVAEIAVSSAYSSPPALDIASLTQAAQKQLAPAAEAVLYGPFLLDPGTQLAPSLSLGPPQPITIQSATVLFWVDDNPAATYQHPVRWALLDAADTGPAINVVKQNWEPWVLPIDASSGYMLASQLIQIPDGALLPRAAQALKPQAAGVYQPLGNGSNTTACAVLIYGPESGAFSNAEAAMRQVMSDVLNIPDSNIFEDTTPGLAFGANTQASTPSRLSSLLSRASKINCKKLYFFYVGHGYQGGIALQKEDNDTSPEGRVNYDYSQLATEIQNTGIPSVCLIISACRSGSAIPAMQGHGFNGEIATAADRDNSTNYNPVPGLRESYWVSAFTSTWTNLGSDASVTAVAQTTVAKLQASPGLTGNGILKGNPRTAIIEAAGGKAFTPAQIVIDNYTDPAQATVSFTVPQPVNFVPGTAPVSMTIGDVTVAKDPNSDGNNSNAKPGLNVTFTVKALKEGITPYTITWTDVDQKTYTGMGVIIVGKGYSATNLTIEVGQQGSVQIDRGAALAMVTTGSTLSIHALDDASLTIAAPSTSMASFLPGMRFTSVSFTGKTPGTATFEATDGVNSTKFTVTVTAPKTASCATGGTLHLAIKNTSDDYNSAGQINMPAMADLPFSVSMDNQGKAKLTLFSTIPQLPGGMGPFDITNACTSSFITTATQPIAAASGVQVGYDLGFGLGPAPINSVDMTIKVGVNRSLYNDAGPTVYHATGSIVNAVFK